MTPVGWVPNRQEILWIDCSSHAGREMRDRHPFLVLSPKAFNDRTSLVIGLPMTTAEYNATNPFAVSVGAASGRKAGKTSDVLCHQPKSFDWRARERPLLTRMGTFLNPCSGRCAAYWIKPSGWRHPRRDTKKTNEITEKIMQKSIPDGALSTPSPAPQNHTLGLRFTTDHFPVSASHPRVVVR